MGDVIFCMTRYQDVGYHSYNDLWRMVKLADYPVIYVDEIDPQSDNTYIFSPANGETMNGWPNAKACIILLQLEWMLTTEHNTPPGVQRVWTPDAGFAKQQGFEYVPLGSDYGLNEVGRNFPADKIYDVSLLSYQTHRRQVVTNQLIENGISLAPVNGLWGRERSAALVQSHTMLHVHQHDNVQTIAPLRWCLAAAHGLPIITETILNRGIFGYSCMVQSAYGFLAQFTKQMLEDKRLLRDYAEGLQHLLCEDYTFRKVVDRHV